MKWLLCTQSCLFFPSSITLSSRIERWPPHYLYTVYLHGCCGLRSHSHLEQTGVEGGRNLSLTTVRKDTVDGIRETPLVFSQIELKQPTGLSIGNRGQCLCRAHLREQQKERDCRPNRNKKCMVPYKLPLPVGEDHTEARFRGRGAGEQDG